MLNIYLECALLLSVKRLGFSLVPQNIKADQIQYLIEQARVIQNHCMGKLSFLQAQMVFALTFKYISSKIGS